MKLIFLSASNAGCLLLVSMLTQGSLLGPHDRCGIVLKKIQMNKKGDFSDGRSECPFGKLCHSCQDPNSLHKLMSMASSIFVHC